MMGEVLLGDHQWLLLLAQGTACLAVGLAASYALSRRAAKAHQVLWIATLAAVIMPSAHWLVNRLELGVLAPEAAPIVSQMDTTLPLLDEVSMVSVPPVEIAAAPPAMTLPETVVASPAVASEPRVPVPWRAVGLACWFVATVLLLGRLLLRFVLGLHLVHRAGPVNGGLVTEALETAGRKVGVGTAVTLRRSERVRSPIIWCWSRRPILLVHNSVERNDRAVDWTGVFCHELAHWRRGDHLTGLFMELLTALVPWHPLLWWTRRRLMLLSEAACDDWVLASGQVGLDYAESLLNLSPEKQLAFLPTVVGKERAMKQRIYRIVKDRCSNPKIGLGWTLAVVVLAAVITAGTALAQRRPSERPERGNRERQEQMEVQELRRAVLHQELEQLVDQARDLEAAIRKHGDEPNPERQALQFRLELKHQLIEAMERRLANLERPAPRRREGRPEIDVRMEEPGRKQDELRGRAGDIERKLDELGDRRPEAREELKMELRKIHENLERLEMERVEIDRSQAGGRQTRSRDMNPEVREVTGHLRDLRQRSQELQEELERIDDKDSERAQDLRRALEETREQMRLAENRLREIGGPAREGRVQPMRPGRERAGDEDQARAREGLMAQIRMTEEKLHEAEQTDRPGAAEKLRRVLEQLHERRETMEGRMREPDRPGPSREGIEGEVEELRQKVDGMHEQMQEMREMLKQLLERRETIEREVEVEEHF